MPVASHGSCLPEQLLQPSPSQPKGMSVRIVCEDMPVVRSGPRPVATKSWTTHRSPLAASALEVPEGATLPRVSETSSADVLPVVRIRKASSGRGRTRMVNES